MDRRLGGAGGETPKNYESTTRLPEAKFTVSEGQEESEDH